MCDSEDLEGMRGACNIGKELKSWLKYWKKRIEANSEYRSYVLESGKGRNKWKSELNWQEHVGGDVEGHGNGEVDTQLLWSETVSRRTDRSETTETGEERTAAWGGWGLLCPRREKSRVRRTCATLLNTGLWRAGLLIWWHIKSIFLEEQHCWICSWMAFLPRVKLTFQQVRLWTWAEIYCHQLASCCRAEPPGLWHYCQLTL